MLKTLEPLVIMLILILTAVFTHVKIIEAIESKEEPHCDKYETRDD